MDGRVGARCESGGKEETTHVNHSTGTYRVELRVPVRDAPPLDAQHRLDKEQVREGVAHRLFLKKNKKFVGEWVVGCYVGDRGLSASYKTAAAFGQRAVRQST